MPEQQDIITVSPSVALETGLIEFLRTIELEENGCRGVALSILAQTNAEDLRKIEIDLSQLRQSGPRHGRQEIRLRSGRLAILESKIWAVNPLDDNPEIALSLDCDLAIKLNEGVDKSLHNSEMPSSIIDDFVQHLDSYAYWYMTKFQYSNELYDSLLSIPKSLDLPDYKDARIIGFTLQVSAPWKAESESEGWIGMEKSEFIEENMYHAEIRSTHRSIQHKIYLTSRIRLDLLSDLQSAHNHALKMSSNFVESLPSEGR
ncbi:MAG: hypothetical protein FJY67_04410 [Calditrichaeota bacterium]|nr:hypothetical protein [Calditrichota bacterium]